MIKFVRTRAAIRQRFYKISNPAKQKLYTLKSKLRVQYFGLVDNGTMLVLKASIVIGRCLTKIRISKGKPRSLWGISPIINMNVQKKSDRLLGIRSKSLVFTTYYITHKFDYNLKLQAAIFSRFFGPYYYRFVLSWAILNFDIFHYFMDRGILLPEGKCAANDELQAYTKANKKLYFYTYGSDCRTREATEKLGTYNLCRYCPEPGRHCICDDRKQANKVRTYALHANALVAMGDMRAYVENHYEMFFWPIDTNEIKPLGQAPKNQNLVIAHAPNHRFFKGTDYLEQAIQELQNEGHKIQLSFTTGKPNSEVLRLFQEADIVADQFTSGQYGYTTLEALAKGKPVLCYIRTQDVLVEGEKSPLINCNPTNLKATLKWLCENKEKLAALGNYGPNYIKKFHSVEAIALRLGKMYLETGKFNSITNKRIQQNMDLIASNLQKVDAPKIDKSFFPPNTYPGEILDNV